MKKRTRIKKQLNVWVAEDLYNSVNDISISRKITKEEIVTRGLVLLFEELCEPLPKATQREVRRPFLGKIARDLT